MTEYHAPVMLKEVLEVLQPEAGATYIDCTVGGGGHSIEIAKRIVPGGLLIGIDRDDDALKAASLRLEEFKNSVILEKGNFENLGEIAERLGVTKARGILLDLGVSSHQLDVPERGFSFRQDALLDMRMDAGEALTAAELVNTLSERELSDLIWKYGEDRWARRIAKFIVKRRPVRTTGELAETIKAAVPVGARAENIHTATRTFQALRIVVNRELESLQNGLESAIRLLESGGRICVLSYHSLEDRIVKETFLRFSGRCKCPPGLPICTCGAREIIHILTRRPISPTDAEVKANPRARSAKLRAAQKL
ncbi:MAG TPA: 16S rRNA (cytosine(1402)-N(4))-methyltransferase [Armatimonadetes bacterium]|nr:16S rRNA (cytosine(1402)-N(4))-methyltransferase [Armatimonadota bacterium]